MGHVGKTVTQNVVSGSEITDGTVTGADLASDVAITTTGDASLKGNVVINEDSADKDFRVESNGNANMLFVDGGNDAVGIGVSNPADYTEHSDDLVVGGSTGNRGITIIGASNGYSIVSLNRSSNTTTTPNGAIEYNHTDNQMYIKAGGFSGLQLNNDGSVNKPYQPTAFAIRGSSRMVATSGGAEVTVPFTEVIDIGNDFASNTFNCPVDGKYFVSFFGMVQNTGATWANVAIKHNGVTKFNAYEDIHSSTTGFNNVATSGIINASATDTIVASFSGGDTNSKLHENNYGGITIQLIA